MVHDELEDFATPVKACAVIEDDVYDNEQYNNEESDDDDEMMNYNDEYFYWLLRLGDPTNTSDTPEVVAHFSSFLSSFFFFLYKKIFEMMNLSYQKKPEYEANRDNFSARTK